ncbi:MAG TPA: TolC family protein [Bacteroidetes bacterium]|nr:TolC family protein [Bacteroidota bacterium]
MQRLLILLIASGWGFVLYAQSPPLLTLKDCIHRAEQNSYKLQSDDYLIAATADQASLTKSQAIPRIGGDLAMENRFLQPYYFNQIWASVHADWSLGDFIQKTGRSAMQDIETRKLEKEQNRLNVIGRSTSLYISVLQVKKQIEILVVRIGFLQHHRELTQGMWKAGIRTRLDVLQTESEMVKLQEDTARLAIVRKNLRGELARLLGWQNTDSLRLTPLQVAAITKSPIPRVSLEILADNPLLASYNSRVKAQQYRTNEIIASQIPHVLLGGGYFADGDPTGDGNYWRINAGITIPIYYGHESVYKKQGSEALVQSLNAQEKEIERELMIHLAKVYERLVNLKGVLDLQNKRQSITGQAVSFAEINYKAGISTNLDYLSAQQRLTSTQLAIEETRLQYTMNLIEFYVTTNQVDKIIALENE